MSLMIELEVDGDSFVSGSQMSCDGTSRGSTQSGCVCTAEVVRLAVLAITIYQLCRLKIMHVL